MSQFIPIATKKELNNSLPPTPNLAMENQSKTASQASCDSFLFLQPSECRKRGGYVETLKNHQYSHHPLRLSSCGCSACGADCGLSHTLKVVGARKAPMADALIFEPLMLTSQQEIWGRHSLAASNLSFSVSGMLPMLQNCWPFVACSIQES